MYLLKRLTGRVHPLQNFLAAFVGGYLVFGENNKVNMQVCPGTALTHIHSLLFCLQWTPVIQHPELRTPL